MIALAGTYQNGRLNLEREYLSTKAVKVIVTFMEDEDVQKKPEKILTIADFSFLQSQKELADYKGNLSEALIEERRSTL